MDLGIIVTFAGIIVAALAGVLGVWMERDRTAPPKWAWVFSTIILVAMVIELSHSVAQATEDAETEEAMARVLEQLTELAENGDNPALEQFIGAELAIQARANPSVMSRLEKRVEAKGGDASSLRRTAAAGRRTSAGLPASKTGRSGRAGMSSRNGQSGRASTSSDSSSIRRTPGSSGPGKAGSKSATSNTSAASKGGGKAKGSSSESSSSSSKSSASSSSSKGGGKSGKGSKGGKSP